jgi:hypothetical protein
LGWIDLVEGDCRFDPTGYVRVGQSVCECRYGRDGAFAEVSERGRCRVSKASVLAAEARHEGRNALLWLGSEFCKGVCSGWGNVAVVGVAETDDEVGDDKLGLIPNAWHFVDLTGGGVPTVMLGVEKNREDDRKCICAGATKNVGGAVCRVGLGGVVHHAGELRDDGSRLVG